MTVGEMISALTKYASDQDYLLMAKSIYSVDVHMYDNYVDNIDLCFVDGNTSDVMINKDGVLVKYLNEE